MQTHYIETVKNSLESIISELAENPSLFIKDPKRDFTRKRKIDFENLLRIIITSAGKSMNKELLDYFDFSVETPSVSAFSQQRSKVLPDAFDFMFREFTKNTPRVDNLYNGYRLLACDGSNLTITTNPHDAETYQISNQYGTVSNHLHLNALYDLLNRNYVDVNIQTLSERNEFRACTKMIDHSPYNEKVILIADRGYENYNIFAHAIEKGWGFVIRGKDINSNGIASGLNFPEKDIFDTSVTLTLTRSQAMAKKKKGYKFMPTIQTFDYAPAYSKREYNISFRVVRFPISEDKYELLITNLDRNEFPISKLKELYHMRWGIETSFRELKYAIGLTSFHSKKVDYIKQEIYARLLLYNYCEMITTYVIETRKEGNKKYQVNFTLAIYICREYLRNKRDLRPPDIELQINRNTLPIRNGRSDPRKVKAQTSVSFLYRVA